MSNLPDDQHDPTAGSGEGPHSSQSQDLNPGGSGGLECPICLQQCQHPVELPCRHVFCFLCIKGVAMQGPNGKCAICRAAIPSSVLTNPQLKDASQLYKDTKSSNGYQWYYESRSGGWWQYDERTMQDLERAFSSNQPSCQLLLAGHIYVVDFTQMIQYRQTNRSVSRRIKRGINLEKRGVAGIRIAGSNTGAGTSGLASSGASPPPQGPGAPMTRRRKGNASAPPGTSHPSGTTSSSGQSSSVASSPAPASSVLGTAESPGPPIHHISDSDDESDEDYNSDYSDVDDDMELGEEEEGLIGDDSDERETEDDEEYEEARDGARAPTRRSDRSNSSNNQTPPPPGSAMGNGGMGGTYSPNPGNGRGSRGAKGGRSSGGGRSNNSSNGTASRSTSNGVPIDSLTVPNHLHQTATTTTPVNNSTNSSVLNSLFLNRCNLEDVVVSKTMNSTNNNTYLDYSSPPVMMIGQVSYAASQTVVAGNTSKVTFERHRSLNREDFL